MNLIEAWKQAKEGQSLRRKSWHGDFLLQRCGELAETIKIKQYSDVTLFADDWEIVKEKQEIAIENVKISCKDVKEYGYTYLLTLPKELPDKFARANNQHEVSMTLEWEE
jgi:hypothetical protein